MKLLQADKKTLEIVGAVSQLLLDDMAHTNDLLVELTGKVEFNKGLEAGFKEGYQACQRDMQRAMFAFNYVAGIVKLEALE
jgi:hypothetical protein